MATDNQQNQSADDHGKARQDQLLLVWERAIQTQMHFAELSIKTRQVGMTVVGATLGLAVVLNKSDSSFALTFRDYQIPITSILCWSAAIVLYAIRLLDVGVYHRMLRGAVAFNEDLERQELVGLFGTSKGLTQAISFFSRHTNATLKNGNYVEGPKRRFHYAGERISAFYWVMIGALIFAGAALCFSGVK